MTAIIQHLQTFEESVRKVLQEANQKKDFCTYKALFLFFARNGRIVTRII